MRVAHKSHIIGQQLEHQQKQLKQAQLYTNKLLEENILLKNI